MPWRTMRGLSLSASVVVAHLVIGAAFARTVHAQSSPSQAEVDRAVALGREGREHYEAGRFGEALERFRAADRIARSPVLVLYIARCERNLGRLVAARDAYRRAAEDPLPTDAPAPFVAARSDAQRELADLEARLPRVRIAVADGADVRVTLDGVVVDAATRAAPIAVDPGEHTVAATSSTGAPLERRFRATEGGELVTIDLAAAPERVAPPESPTAPPVAPTSSGGTIVPGLIALGVGAAGLGVGVATGLVASSKTSDIESRCDGTSCLASDRPLADEASTFATVSTVGFIVGGVGIASGVVLLVALSGDEPGGSAARPVTSLRVGIAPRGVSGELRF